MELSQKQMEQRAAGMLSTDTDECEQKSGTGYFCNREKGHTSRCEYRRDGLVVDYWPNADESFAPYPMNVPPPPSDEECERIDEAERSSFYYDRDRNRGVE